MLRPTRWLRFLLLLLAASIMIIAHAARSQQPDPRLAGPLTQALQAQLALQQAMLRMQQEDAEAQKATLWGWFLASKIEAGEKKERSEGR